MLLRIATMLAAAMALAVEANAAVTPFAAECRPDLNVQADARGAVRINGKGARLIPRPDGQTTAVAGGVYVDITPRGREPPLVTYTARDKSVGTCEVVSFREPDGAVALHRPLADTRWRLVEFQSMDDAQGKTRPHDPAAYTMHLRADGSVQMQLNCNRAQGTWSARPAADGTSGGFEFGPLAATRALCPPPSMDEMIAAQARFVRGYLLKDGNLYLSLMADGGIFAWTPDPAVGGSAPIRPAGPAEGGPRNWQLAGSGSLAALRETPSAWARVVARLARGTILDNLGCQAGDRTDGRVWCDVQPLGGGPRGYLPADLLAPATAPDGTVPTGADDSALRAGQGRFDATGKLPCAQQPGLPPSPCDFGAARAGGGYATVVVTRPDGRSRAIFFRLGRAIGADTSQADGMPPFAAVRDGDTYRIRVGTERYEVPRDVVSGR
jgi:heat shock protein HslJ